MDEEVTWLFQNTSYVMWLILTAQRHVSISPPYLPTPPFWLRTHPRLQFRQPKNRQETNCADDCAQAAAGDTMKIAGKRGTSAFPGSHAGRVQSAWHKVDLTPKPSQWQHPIGWVGQDRLKESDDCSKSGWTRKRSNLKRNFRKKPTAGKK